MALSILRTDAAGLDTFVEAERPGIVVDLVALARALTGRDPWPALQDDGDALDAIDDPDVLALALFVRDLAIRQAAARGLAGVAVAEDDAPETTERLRENGADGGVVDIGPGVATVAFREGRRELIRRVTRAALRLAWRAARPAVRRAALRFLAGAALTAAHDAALERLTAAAVRRGLTIVRGPVAGGKSQWIRQALRAGEVLADVTPIDAALRGVVRDAAGKYPVRLSDEVLAVTHYARAALVRAAHDADVSGYVTTSDSSPEAVERLRDRGALGGVKTISANEARVRARLADPNTGRLSAACEEAIARWFGREYARA